MATSASNSQLISDDFIHAVNRQKCAHGLWRPVAWWACQMDNADANKLRKALEKQGLLNRVLGDHGCIRIQLSNRNVRVEGCDKLQKRWFVCVSSPGKPEMASMDKASFNDVTQASWNQFHPVEMMTRVEQQESVSEQNTIKEQSTPHPARPEDQIAPAPTTTRAMSPSVDGPQVLKDDNNLLQFFSSIMSADHIRKADLFLPNVSTVSLKKKLKSFGMQLATNDHQKTHASFHDAPQVHVNKDMTTMEPDPCLTNRFAIPMSVPAMSEVAQATIDLSSRCQRCCSFQSTVAAKELANEQQQSFHHRTKGDSIAMQRSGWSLWLAMQSLMTTRRTHAMQFTLSSACCMPLIRQPSKLLLLICATATSQVTLSASLTPNHNRQ